MINFQCACLVAIKNQHLLLVRVRDNQQWYFPGGKIDAGEMPEQTLIREVREELAVAIIPSSIEYLTTVIGPTHDNQGTVELICFNAAWNGIIKPCAEISEVAYLNYQQRALFAPAVLKFYQQWLSESKLV